MALLWQSVLAAIAPVMHATACSPESISLVMLQCTRSTSVTA